MLALSSKTPARLRDHTAGNKIAVWARGAPIEPWPAKSC